MTITNSPIPGVKIVETNWLSDQRGHFFRSFCDEELDSILEGRKVRQINVSLTKTPGAIRGLHFQYPPYAETKFVRCIAGRVWDVALDLRSHSPTFLRWFAQELSADNRQMLVIPEGCAHGFQVLEANSQLLYLHTQPYTPTAESGVAYNEPAAAIDWPLPAQDVSDRDLNFPRLDKSFPGINV